MNLKKQFSIVILLISSMIYSQDKTLNIPDYKLIKKNIENKDSNFFYPNLLQRLFDKDTLITKEEYFHLYYGNILQKNYDPYKRPTNEEKIQKYYRSENLNKKDYADFFVLANQSLKEFPLDLRLMNFLAYVHHLNGDDLMAKKVSINFQGILGAIMSTGDGLKCETGFHVIAVSHEYVILNMFELENVSQSLIGNCDYLAFEKDKYKINGLYFDISKMREKNLEMFKEK